MKRWVSAGSALLALAGCGLDPIVVGPADLDTTSPRAPRCGGQHYPHAALAADEKGVVVVGVTVGPQGDVLSASIDTPAADEHLNAAALNAVAFCRFAPAAARKVRLTVVYDFVGRNDVVPTGVVRIGVQPSLQGGS